MGKCSRFRSWSIPRMNKIRSLPRPFIVAAGVGDGLETFPVVRFMVSQGQRGVSAPRTFHNHDVSPVLDMFEASRG